MLENGETIRSARTSRTRCTHKRVKSYYIHVQDEIIQFIHSVLVVSSREEFERTENEAHETHARAR